MKYDMADRLKECIESCKASVRDTPDDGYFHMQVARELRHEPRRRGRGGNNNGNTPLIKTLVECAITLLRLNDVSWHTPA
ncbi:hypothetical protein CIB48_g32 [Xylaria polymorpha]|nr:hypothetical protein CIB48_g32 [Xylaria polymorpha]